MSRIGAPVRASAPLSCLSVVIPARDEVESLPGTLSRVSAVLREYAVPHEIVVVDDGSSDKTWTALEVLGQKITELRPIRNCGPNGFGRAVVRGLRASTGDAVVIMMADASDDPMDVVGYWRVLNEGWDCVFGSRFISGSHLESYPKGKWILNRFVNFLIRVVFGLTLNDTTNAFKAYRRSVIEGCEPLISPHFNLTVELPLKAIVRGYTWTVVPISWRNRRFGAAKLKLKEMGSRYFFICAYVWLEKYFSRGDYMKKGGGTPGVPPESE